MRENGRLTQINRFIRKTDKKTDNKDLSISALLSEVTSSTDTKENTLGVNDKGNKGYQEKSGNITKVLVRKRRQETKHNLPLLIVTLTQVQTFLLNKITQRQETFLPPTKHYRFQTSKRLNGGEKEIAREDSRTLCYQSFCQDWVFVASQESVVTVTITFKSRND